MRSSWQFPLDLPLTDGTILHASEMVRYMPQRRLVCRGTWNGHAIYAKIFIGNQAQRYAVRDASGVRALADANILTPALLHAGALAHEPGEVLVFSAIAGGRNAEQVLEYAADDATARLDLALKLVRVVAEHHRAGIIQSDLYPKNFLLEDTLVYTLDGDGIRQLSAPVGRRRSLDNLALLLSKFDVLDVAAWLPALLQRYASVRGWEEVALGEVRHRIAWHRRRVAAKYADSKVFRECTDVHVERSWRYYLAFMREYFSPELRTMLGEADTLLQGARVRLLKQGNTCTVSLTEVAGKRLVIKRYNIKNFWHGASRAWRPSRAALSWSNAHRLRIYGIATASPVAFLERRYGLIRRQAYFLAEYVDAPDVAQFFSDEAVDFARKASVAGRVARLLCKLHALGIAHGDLKAGNIKIVDDKPWLIDLDSLREYRWNWLARLRHVRDLRRFLRNWQDDPAMTALLGEALRKEYKDAAPLVAAGIKSKLSEQA